MKVVVTGSLGHIGQPLTEELVQKGHAVTVVSSKSGKQKDIEALGATAAIGSIEDAAFLADTFAGADVVYCMIPPADFSEPDRVAYYHRVAGNYVQAIQQSRVLRVIHLSSYGAHLAQGTGIIVGAHQAELLLNEVPGIDLTHMRPAYFYYNLYAFTNMIREAGRMMANYGGDDRIVMVAPADIAAAIAEEIERPTENGVKVRYVASDERTGHDIAAILGAAIGKPDLKWEIITDKQMQSGMETHGAPTILAANLVEMFGAIRNGKMTEDYYRHEPVLGKVKLEDFVKEFAVAFQADK